MNYAGHPLNIIAQTYLQLSCGRRSIHMTVLIQKQAPNELLVGTDVLGRLGIGLTVETSEGVVNRTYLPKENRLVTSTTDRLQGEPPAQQGEQRGDI